MIRSYPARYPDEVLDYEFDWTATLRQGETVLSATVEPLGSCDMVAYDVATTLSITTFWVKEGSPSKDGRLALLATTSQGRKIGFDVGLPVLPR